LTKPLQDTNVWYYGDAGTGKTGWVMDLFGPEKVYNKDKSKYWNDYQNQPVVLVDDIEKTDTFMLGNLKKWAQHIPFSAETKYGGFCTIRPEHILVTSNYHPEDIWPAKAELEPISRRFRVM
jgi:hypothetical protein